MRILKSLLKIVGAVLLIGIGFVAWRVGATQRGAARVYRQLAQRISPVEARLVSGQDPDQGEIVRLASDRETRVILYDSLDHHGKRQLFPAEYATPEKIAEGVLVLWLLHPNELNAAPDEVELMATEPAPGETSSPRSYFLFRFRTKPPHWAAKKGWLAGVVGPYAQSPRTAMPFSMFEPYDSRTPAGHIQVMHDVVTGGSR